MYCIVVGTGALVELRFLEYGVLPILLVLIKNNDLFTRTTKNAPYNYFIFYMFSVVFIQNIKDYL